MESKNGKRRVLHAADIHLDSPLQKLQSYEDAPVDQIRGASRRALENMVELAIDEAVDLVVIAGDLYDGDWRDQNTGLFFVGQAAKLVGAGIPVVVIRGNHDAANIMTSSLPLPKNPDGSDIMMASAKVDCRTFESLGISVHGRSFSKRAETKDLSKRYPKPHAGMFNLGLLHTSLTGAEGHDSYSPCTPIQLTDKEYDYWALGHVHLRGSHGIEAGAPIVFSGNVQGRHIRETGEKGCIIVDIDSRNEATHSFHPLDVVRWEVCHLDARSIEHTDEIIDQFESWLNQKIGEAAGRMIVSRVSVEGPCNIHNALHQNRNRIESSLRAIAVAHGDGKAWLEKLRMKTTTPNDTIDVGDLEGPLASVAKVVDDIRLSEDRADLVKRELSSLLTKLPLELHAYSGAFSTENFDQTDELIESAAADLLGRIQGSEATKQ
ncbi:putative metallophosphoesterase YhaO [Planctomycetes bacterium CA13]|uniref:Putative metallophosphoesterase YhaO n=1 Tax=Novipirellula herctigrandis TaxID=2527986 RepID=A0A5C5Z8D3_9BACT|nr:putative metallophosphoesterase YhaO [Planctomycetes bacterium CA13]